MNVFMTNGTLKYLRKLKEEHVKETLILMVDDNTALLLHETNGMSIYKEPRSFEVLEKIGTYEKANFFVMNHIPVTDEGRPLFEHRFKHRDGKIEKQPGFIGLRVLRPLSNNTYVILTFWENEKAFNGWKLSDHFGKSHKKSATVVTGEEAAPSKIFSSPSYTTKYWIPDDDLEDDWS